jgi:photosystem II stability/assembly factor-like uncharacterized protein
MTQAPVPTHRLHRWTAGRLSLLLAVSLLATPAGAGEGVWTGGGPAGGHGLDLLQDPDQPTVLYLRTQANGIFRSSDSGATWGRANAGLPAELSDFGVAAGGVLYAVHRSSALVWRSPDGGANWQPTQSSIPGDLVAWGVAAEATVPGTVWVAAQDGEQTRIFLSRDSGDHWTLSGSYDGAPFDLAASPLLPGALFLSPRQGHVVRSDDGGRTWTPMLFARHWRELAIDAQNPRRLVTVSRSVPEIYESLDGGATWRHLATLEEPLGYDARAIAIDPADGDRLTVAFPYNLWESTDGGLVWSRTEPPGQLLDLHDIVLLSSRTHGRMLLTPEGVYRGSSGYGRLSVEALEARAADWIWSASEEPRIVVVGGFGTGPWLSFNGGMQWRPRFQGLLAHGVWNVAFAGTRDGSTLYAGQGDDLWRSRLGGPWRPFGVDLALGNVTVVEVLPSGRILIADLGDQSLAYSSENGGRSWSPYYTAPEPAYHYPLEISVDPTDERRSLLAVVADTGTCFVDRTTDGGTTWHRVLDDEIPYWYCGVLRIEWDPSSPDGVYLLVRLTVPRPNDPDDFQLLLRSLDGGATWEAIGEGLPCFGAVAVDPGNSDVYVGCDRLYVSHDRGLSWAPFDAAGFPSDLRFISALTAVPDAGGVTLHAGTNAGIYSYTITEHSR